MLKYKCGYKHYASIHVDTPYVERGAIFFCPCGAEGRYLDKQPKVTWTMPDRSEVKSKMSEELESENYVLIWDRNLNNEGKHVTKMEVGFLSRKHAESWAEHNLLPNYDRIINIMKGETLKQYLTLIEHHESWKPDEL